MRTLDPAISYPDADTTVDNAVTCGPAADNEVTISSVPAGDDIRPTHSDISQNSDQMTNNSGDNNLNDDSSNELVVDCDSSGEGNIPGKFILFYLYTYK